MSDVPAASLRTLVERLVDYAGLFPPAALPMREAARAYAGYRASGDAWALGRFVIPVARLAELDAEIGDAGDRPWELSMIAGENEAEDVDAIARFLEGKAGRFTVDAVEARASSADRVERLARAFDGRELYVEVAAGADGLALLPELARHGLRAKLRTGGVTEHAFPPTDRVAEFIMQCASLSLAFKATAGLHHPVCGTHPLTYEDDAPQGAMFGFLNVFLASALAAEGGSTEDVAALLTERNATAFRFTDVAAEWKGHTFSTSALRQLRAARAISFGSCSFREPIDDLHAMGVL